MSISSEIDRINANVANTYSVLEGAGADMPAQQNTDNLPETASTIKAVLYTEQTLTEEQKAQAIENIGAVSVNDLFDSYQSNYADMSTLTEGMLHTNGTVYTGDSYANYYYFDMFIPVSEGDTISIQWTENGTKYWSSAVTSGGIYMPRVAAYDENKNVVSSSGASLVNSYTAPSGIAFVKLTVYNTCIDGCTEFMIVKNATSIVDYVEYGEAAISTIKPQYIPNTSNDDETANKSDVIYSAIPNAIHITVGKEFKMYYKNVMSNYTDRLWLGYTSGITVKRYAEYLSITATEPMTKSVNWKVYDNSFNVLDNGTMTVIATADTAKTSKVLVIGDSTVTQSNAISQKLLDCYGASDGTLTLLGTRGTSPALHEGRAGWTSTQYCTVASNGSVTNPFYNSGFDFSYYMTQQGYSGVDIVVIQLGINDIFSMTHENFNAIPTLNNLDTMIASILTYDADIKVIVNLISVPNGNGTSFTDAYNTTQIDFVYLANTIRLSKAMVEHFADNTSVTISPNNCVLDATTDINDGVHPNSTGYAKLGQAIYETINGIYEPSDDEPEGGEVEDTGELWDVGNRVAAVNTYKPAATAGTFSNSYYYYPAAYTGPLANTITMSDVEVGSNTLQFKSGSSAYGVFVPFVGLDSTKTYRFTVNPEVAGFRVYLMNYDSTGVYKSNAVIVDKTTGLKTYDFTPTAGYQIGFCFAALTATKNILGTFKDLSLVELDT